MINTRMRDKFVEKLLTMLMIFGEKYKNQNNCKCTMISHKNSSMFKSPASESTNQTNHKNSLKMLQNYVKNSSIPKHRAMYSQDRKPNSTCQSKIYPNWPKIPGTQ